MKTETLHQKHARLVAHRIADRLFTNGILERSVRLKLELESGGDGGGWCRGAVISQIIAELLPDPSLSLVSVYIERQKQNLKWGEQNHDPITWSAILSEECGEFAQAALHQRFGGPAAAGLREEAVQCAAVALQIVECLDRQAAPRDAEDDGSAVRESEICVCKKPKEKGLTVCWHCFKYRTDVHPFKDFQGSYEQWVATLPAVP